MNRWDIGTISIISSTINWIPGIGILSLPALAYLVKQYGATSWSKAWLVMAIMLTLMLLFSLMWFAVIVALIMMSH